MSQFPEPDLHCLQCKRFIAKKNCDVCSAHICLGCVRIEHLRLRVLNEHDRPCNDAFIKLVRCKRCFSEESLPVIKKINIK